MTVNSHFAPVCSNYVGVNKPSATHTQSTFKNKLAPQKHILDDLLFAGTVRLPL